MQLVKCEFYCHAVRWIRFSSHFNFFCSVRLQNNKVDLLHVFTRPSLCMSSIYWAWFCESSEKSLFSEIKHLYAKKAFHQIFVILKPKFCKIDYRSFEQPWVNYPDKTLPLRPKKLCSMYIVHHFRDWPSLVRMVLTMNTWLPTEEELTVEEVRHDTV